MMKVIIVGGVAAGMSAAAKLKRNLRDEVDIVVFEQGDEVSYGACGIPFYLSGRIKEASALIERTPEQFAEAGIAVKLRHRVVGVDVAAKTVAVRDLDSGREAAHGYDKLIVASGARVRRIPPLDVDRENLHVIRNVGGAERLRQQLEQDAIRKVIVVGAGFIGLEVAEACAARGKEVTVVEFAERVLSVMDPEITDQLTAELRRNGVRVRTGSKLVGLDVQDNRIVAVTIENCDGEKTEPADLVINCAGIIPNADFIDVEKAVNGAVIVNGHMETSAPDVYAAGDCSVMTSFLTGEHLYAPLGTNANKQGKIIADLLAGKPARRFRLIGSSALRLFGLDAAKVGLCEIDAQKLNLDYEAHRITANSVASYYGDEKVMVKLIYDRKTRRILGAQTLGQGTVVPRANYFAVAISAGMTVDEFGYLDLCYSPPFNGVWDAALIAATSAK